MSMHIHRVLIVLALPTVLAGCGWLTGEDGYFRDRGDDYRKARTLPPMSLPEGKKSESIEPLYPIPVEKTDALLGEEFEVPRPAPLVADPEEGVVRIQKLGDQQWILLNGAPGAVWPRIRGFLVGNQISLDREDASQGVLETAWLRLKGPEGRREKYRFRVDQGVQRDSTEVYVSQLVWERKDGEEGAEPAWGERSMDSERETWMVKELAGYLADTSDAASVSLLAQGISTANKVYIVRGEGGVPRIDLRLPFERAWASLGRALPRAGFSVTDLDRSTGVYYVKYDPAPPEPKAKDGETPPEGDVEIARPERERKGFFKRMFSWWGDDEGEDEDNPALGRSYRVQMNNASDGVTIDIRREDGSEFEKGENEFLLGVVKAHLA